MYARCREMWGRYSGDTGEMWGRCRGDTAGLRVEDEELAWARASVRVRIWARYRARVRVRKGRSCGS